MTEQAADAAVDQACRMLRLPTIRCRFAEVADAAQREQLTHRGFLAELLMAECDDRDRRRSTRRIVAANFPREKSLALSGVDLDRVGVFAAGDVADAAVTPSVRRFFEVEGAGHDLRGTGLRLPCNSVRWRL